MSGCSGLRQLPDSLGYLKHLQHLKLSGCSSVKAVPRSLCSPTQLQYLNLSSFACLEGLPEGIGSLVDLRHLYMSGCEQIRELQESLMKIQSLSHLNLSCCRRIRRGSLAGVRGLTALQHLDISRLWQVWRACTSKVTAVSIIPGWLMAISRHLTNLVSFELRDLPTCSNLLPLGQLPHLDKLSLWKLPAIKRIDREFCGGNRAFRRLLSF